MPDLYIVGAGGLGRGLADALLYDKKNHIEKEFNEIYFVDDNVVSTEVNGVLVQFNLDEFLKIEKECLVINAIGSPKTRKDIQNKLNSNPYFKFPNYIDEDVKLYKHVNIGQGNIVTRGAVLSTNINIGDFNLIHFNCTLGHDVEIGNFNCIYPLSSLSGYTILGDGNMIGTGSCSLPQTILENHINVGANSLLKGKYQTGITVLGSPAERIDK